MKIFIDNDSFLLVRVLVLFSQYICKCFRDDGNKKVEHYYTVQKRGHQENYPCELAITAAVKVVSSPISERCKI